MTKNLIHIDCTLRDGGYYNNWDFSKNLIQEYLNAISCTSINYAEIGFRTTANSGFKGALAFSKDEYLNNLNIPEKIQIGVMINTSELQSELNYKKILKTLFPNPAKLSPIKLVRLASHLNEINLALEASKWLVDKGYKVGVNLMQISEINQNDLKSISQKINDYPISVFYFADSIGCLKPNEVKNIVETINKFSKKAIGIHTHDNLGLALSNTLIAKDNGVNWLDSTITGMGRGPGNCKTEELLLELNSDDKEGTKISPILSLIKNYFDSLKEEFKWGSNPYYYLSGKYKIHPSYVQSLLNNSIFSDDDKLMIINKLKNKKASRFSPDYLSEEFINFKEDSITGDWEPKSILNKKEVLILATGPSTKKYKSDLENYIKKINPFVIALNTPSFIDEKLISLRAACHPLRIITDIDKYKTMSQPLICPFSAFDKNFSSKIKLKNVLDFGLSTKNNTFKFNKNFCILPKPLVLLYAISIAISGNAKSIKLTGVDGYLPGDPRNEELNELLEILVKLIPNTTDLYSLTPTSYRYLKQKSIFAY